MGSWRSVGEEGRTECALILIGIVVAWQRAIGNLEDFRCFFHRQYQMRSFFYDLRISENVASTSDMTLP